MFSIYRRQLFLRGLAIGKSVGWMNFYIFTMIPVRLISGILRLLTDIPAIREQKALMFYYPGLLIGLFALSFLRCIAAFFTYNYMKKIRPIGYYLNFVVLIFDGAHTILGGVLLNEMGNSDLPIILYVIPALIWIGTNSVYFIKRRRIFYITEQKDLLKDLLANTLSTQMTNLEKELQKSGFAFPGREEAEKTKEDRVLLLEKEAEDEKENIRSDIYAYCPFCGGTIDKAIDKCPHCFKDLEN